MRQSLGELTYTEAPEGRAQDPAFLNGPQWAQVCGPALGAKSTAETLSFGCRGAWFKTQPVLPFSEPVSPAFKWGQ